MLTALRRSLAYAISRSDAEMVPHELAPALRALRDGSGKLANQTARNQPEMLASQALTFASVTGRPG